MYYFLFNLLFIYTFLSILLSNEIYSPFDSNLTTVPLRLLKNPITIKTGLQYFMGKPKKLILGIHPNHAFKSLVATVPFKTQLKHSYTVYHILFLKIFTERTSVTICQSSNFLAIDRKLFTASIPAAES